MERKKKPSSSLIKTTFHFQFIFILDSHDTKLSLIHKNGEPVTKISFASIEGNLERR